ncbi:methyltransferase [Colletotrichum asianum]
MANPHQDAELVPDDEIRNDDSEADLQSLYSEVTSLRTSILENRIENGRSYHTYKDGKHAWPNDAEENERLDMQNEICFLTFHNKLGFAPPCDPDAKVGRVLDLGTGTGLWAIEYADEHPDAEVLGVDLSPIQPRDVPPNLKFEVDDVEEDWLYSQKFDYIHLRFLNGSIADWKKLFKKAYDFTKPGGYFELQENDFLFASDDGTLSPEKPLAKFSSLVREACVKFGRQFIDVPLMEDMMKQVGFQDVALQRFKWPSNPWPKGPHYKKIGEWNYHNFVAAAEALAMGPLTRAHGYTKEEVDVFLIDVRKNMRDPKIHSYLTIYTLVGRKPLDS